MIFFHIIDFFGFSHIFIAYEDNKKEVIFMAKNKKKEKHMGSPIEEQNTAAWANIENKQPESRVPIPNYHEVKNAKEWVDSNQK